MGGGEGGSTLHGNYSLRTFPPLPHADGRPIPNLDGGEGSSEQIIFGTNLDLSKEVEGEDKAKGEEGKDKAEGEGEMEEVVESTQQVHAQETDQQSNL